MKTHTRSKNEPVEVWAGCDVAKPTFDASVAVDFRPGQRWAPATMPHKSFPRTREGVRDFLLWADAIVAEHVRSRRRPTLRVVMESTGSYSADLATWLWAERPQTAPAIINPAYIRAFAQSLGLRTKTDPVDACVIARYGAERSPVAERPRPYEWVQLRTLSRERDHLVHLRVAEENRAAEPCESPLARRLQTHRIERLRRDITAIEQAMNDLVAASPVLQAAVALLDSLPGVGRLTAMVILAELGDLTRFQRARQLTAFVGVSPRLHLSGSSVRRRTRLCNAGNSRARTALYMAAMATLKTNNALAHLYSSLVERGKPHKAALGVIMRKLLVLMRAVLLSKIPYQDAALPCAPEVEKP